MEKGNEMIRKWRKGEKRERTMKKLKEMMRKG